MSEEQYKDGNVSLRLVHRTSVDGQPVSVQEFFDTMVVPFFQKMIPIVSGKKDDVDYDVLEVSDRLAPELRVLLEAMALVKPSAAELRRNEDWLEGKMAVKLVQDESCWVLVARAADDMGVDEFAPGEDYYLDAKLFAKGVDSINPYEGLRFWNIRKTVEEEKGVNSEAAKNIRRVSELIRTLLYNVAVPESERVQMARELYVLRMQTGAAAAAAIAMIQVFVKGYRDGKWMDVVGTSKDRVVDVYNGDSFNAAMRRLQIGHFDLGKLAGIGLTIFE